MIFRTHLVSLSVTVCAGVVALSIPVGCGGDGGAGGDGSTGADTYTSTSAGGEPNSAAFVCYDTLESALSTCQSTDDDCIVSCTDETCLACTTSLCSCFDEAYASAEMCASSAGAPGDTAFWGCLQTCFQSFCSCDIACTTLECADDCESTLEDCDASCTKPFPYP